ncbi:DMT family transporter [Halosquirtibacter xylanolyticus]|uniref:DMT family transporter n=1 Tax=Halosquirtibacter xylanolyticus TaxID=3374599 RepID=UPI0037498361|nr:DMT family transporter [Prolixibacteraceae bacterium]
MVNTDKKSLLLLHLVVLIYGFTGVLGKLIDMDAVVLVWYRIFFAFISLGGYMIFTQRSFRVRWKDLLQISGIGLIVAIHWITFFYSIKISNISVALGTFSVGTLFASILEPLFFRKKVKKLEVITGLLIIIGLYIIFNFEFKYFAGIMMAIFSAFLATLFTVLNRFFANERFSPITVTFYEMVAGFIGITIWLGLKGRLNSGILDVSQIDLFYLIILGVVCTAFAFVLSVLVMRKLSAYTVVLTVNLEPVYSIILAQLLFSESERMSFGFFIGTFILLLAVFLFPIVDKYTRKKSPSHGI